MYIYIYIHMYISISICIFIGIFLCAYDFSFLSTFRNINMQMHIPENYIQITKMWHIQTHILYASFYIQYI